MSIKPLRTIALTATCALLAVAGLLLVLGRPTHAAPDVRYVASGGSDTGNDCTDPANPCRTVQHAVDQAAAGDEIRVAAGTYAGVQGRPAPSGYPGATTITQVVYISQSLALRGGYTTTNWTDPDPQANPTIVDAQGQGRGLFIGADVTVTVEGLRVTGGDATGLGGSAWNNDAGGGVYLYRSTTTLSGTVIYSNTACTTSDESGYGGGLHALDGDTTLLYSQVLSNTASRDGGGYGGGAGFYGSGSSATLIGNTVHGNIAGVMTSRGGGLDFNQISDALLHDNLIISNTALVDGGYGYPSGNGGGIAIVSVSAITLTDNTIRENVAFNSSTTYGGGGSGGGVYEDLSGVISMTGNLIISNTAGLNRPGSGGGMFLSSNDAVLTGNTFRGNTASRASTGRGGGLYMRGADTIEGNIFEENTASRDYLGYGGGVYFDMTLGRFADNTVTGNVASQNGDGDGGGCYVYLYRYGLSLEGNRILSNTASLAGTGRGGGIILADADDLPLTGNTVQGNVASRDGDGDGGGLYLGGSDVILEGSYILSNTATLNGAATGRGGGLFISQGQPTLRNNIVAQNDAATQGSGLWAGGASGNPLSARLLHTTIADNHSSGQGVYAGDYAALVFTNTIIAGHASVGITTTAGAVVTATATLWNDNDSDVGGPGNIYTATNLYDDPAFVNPAAWDYHLTAGSPAVDAGVDSGVTTDIDGDPRPLSSGYDLGADEYSLVAVQLAPDHSAVVTFGVVTYTHTLTNGGNYTDTFTLAYHSTQGWAQVNPTGPVTLAQGAARAVWVTVTVPTDAVSGIVDTTVITATSARDGSVYDTATDTTTVRVMRIYIPLAMRDYGP